MLALLTSIECLHRQAGKSSGRSVNLPMKLFGQLAIGHDDQPALHGRTILGFVGLVRVAHR